MHTPAEESNSQARIRSDSCTSGQWQFPAVTIDLVGQALAGGVTARHSDNRECASLALEDILVAILVCQDSNGKTEVVFADFALYLHGREAQSDDEAQPRVQAGSPHSYVTSPCCLLRCAAVAIYKAFWDGTTTC